MDDPVQKVVVWHAFIMCTGLLCYSYEGYPVDRKQMHYSRRSPFLTSLLNPIPSARRSIRGPLSGLHGQSHSGSITPPCVRFHRLGLPVTRSLPHTAQTLYSSEASRTRTFERSTWRLSMERSAGASACGVASYSIKYASCDLSSHVA